MERPNNYLLQAQQAKDRFLTYKQDALIRKLNLPFDGDYLYVTMLAQAYRIQRKTGHTERFKNNAWIDANSHGEVLTLLDLICDSRESRFVSGRWKNMQSFGLMFHQNLLENANDPWAEKFQADPEGLRKACLALKGTPFPHGDVAYILELFDGLPIVVQLWFGDEEFPASLRLLWDENALMYIKYETMYFAKGILLKLLAENM